MSSFIGNHFMPQRDNLQLFVDFNNPNCVSGTTWRDLSGNGRNGTVTGTPTYNADSVVMTGTQAGSFANISHPTESTIIMMLKISGSASRINPWNQAYGGHGTWTAEPAGTLSMYFGDSGSNSTPYINTGSVSNDEFTDDTWNMWGITRDTTHWQRYKDTTASTETSHTYGTLAADSNLIYVGSGYQENFEGQIGFFALWDKRLTTAEVTAIHDVMASRYTT